jgi:ankyrin repeat protein
MRLLVEKEANVEAKDNSEWTALYYTVDNGYETVVRLLIKKKTDIKAKDIFR